MVKQQDESRLVGKLIEQYNLSKSIMDKVSTDFPQLKQLADGVPLDSGQDSVYVGDTTVASLVRSIPRDSLQQLPTFSAGVNGSKQNLKALFCNYLMRNNVFNEDTFGKGLLSTLQMGGELALTYGFVPFLVSTKTIFNEFGSMLQMLHYSDVGLEPGVLDNGEGAYNFVVAHIPETRLDRLIANAKDNPNSSWNYEALKELKNLGPDDVDYSRFASEPESTTVTPRNNTYTIVTRYEVGKGGKFITFSPKLSTQTLRTIENKSKFGYQRVLMLVIDPAPLSPCGISRVRLASPNQNLNNLYYGNIGSMFLLNSKPALFVKGRFAAPVYLKQGARWTTTDPWADVQVKEMRNSSLDHFTSFMQQTTSQIQNIMGSATGSAKGDANAFGWGRTAPGIKAQQKQLGAATNQITNILENFLRQYALVALDTFLSEQSGVEDVIVDDETKNAINRLYPDTIGEDNIIQIDWEDFYRGKPNPETGELEGGIDKLTVEIELGIAKDELEEKKRGDLQDTLTVLAQNSEALGPQAKVRVNELTDMLLEKTVPEAKRLELDEMPMPDVMPQEEQQLPPQM